MVYLILHFQINYAALDAIVALLILEGLVQMKVSRQDRRESAAAANRTSPPLGDSVSFQEERQTADLAKTQVATTNESTSVESRDHHVSTLGKGPAAGSGHWLLQEYKYHTMLSLCQGIVDVTFKPPRRSSNQVRPDLKHN